MTRDAAAEAAETLYAAPLDQFVAERKRLAAELKAGGDKAAAKTVAELRKPTTSAWVVNRLWRDASDEIDALFAASARMRGGDFAAAGEQRATLASLRKRAGAVLRDGGHKPAESMLQRVQTTLQALGALGTWEPDAPGQLTEDRDPPGFEVLGGLAGKLPEIRREERPAAKPAREKPRAAPRAKERDKQKREEAAAKEREREHKLREREVARLEKALARAEEVAAARARDVDRAKADLDSAESAATDARRQRNELERDLDRARRRL